MVEDKFINFLIAYYNEHKTISDIPRDLIVNYKQEPLKIGEFLGAIRRQHRLYIKGKSDRGCKSPLTLSRYKALDEMNFIWEPSTVKQQALEERDPALEFVIAYYDQHHTYENLPEEVEIDGKKLNIRAFLSHIRTNHKRYLSGQNLKGSNSSLALKRYAELDKRNFDWEPKLRKQREFEEDDKFIRYLEGYFQENGTLENVPKTVTFEDETLNIDNFLSDRRKKHRKKELNPEYKPSQLELKRWASLDAMGYDWNFHEKRKQALLENDPFIRYLQWHYNEYGTINNISPKQEVTFEGETLRIGVFINDCRKKHYAYTTKKVKAASVKSPLAIKRYEELEKLEIDWRPSESNFSVAKHAKTNGLRPKTLKKYIAKFNGDIAKATKICQAARRYDTQVQQGNSSKSPTLETIAKEFEVDISTLLSILNRPNLRENTSSAPLKYDTTTSLRKFCLDNGLNYTVIQKAIKLKMKGLCPDDLQSLINRCVVEYKVKGQQKPSTWIYSKYGNELLVSHLLIYLNLDPTAIFHDMSKNCLTLEEAIENNSFQRNSSQQYNYLEPLFHDLIAFYKRVDNSEEYTPETAPNAIVTFFEGLIENYNLTKEEFQILQSSFIQYTNSIEQYKLFNVGFEKAPEKRVAKILAYKLDDDEIEEAFFMPLHFDQKVLIGRDSELYKRRVLLKNLTVCWNLLSPEEQLERRKHYSLTGEELNYITETRKTIDQTKAKIKTK